MGQTQFIPSTFLATAVDQDGDGRRDIWTSRADALASAANLLAKAGWVRGQSWAREVSVPPGFDFSLTEGPRETPAWWADKGVRRADGLPWAAADAEAKAQLVAAGRGERADLPAVPQPLRAAPVQQQPELRPGRRPARRSVCRRGTAGAPLATGNPLSLVDRMTAQRALTALGFDAGQPDGVVGMGTRKALREWQKARGLTADGYLSADMVRRLREEASTATATPAA